jgi:H+-transporting ATPase
MITALKLQGLTTPEAIERQQRYGTNQISEERVRPLRMFLRKFWGPIPWMLEATLLFQLLLGKYADALIIVVMLIVNALISSRYERKAQAALALLQQRLAIHTRVLRDGEWQILVAQQLVPDDIIRLRVGDMVPADIELIDGFISVDQSSLTGETELVDIDAGQTAYTASVIKRGEGIARITATGTSTSYSKSAKLIELAKTTYQGDLFVQRIVTALMGFTLVLAAIVIIYALIMHLSISDTLLFTLALLISAIPVSLPVTFTLATAIGASELARQGVLATRLPAIKEVASMDVLCSDKTGTITKNELIVSGFYTYNAYTRKKLLRLASLASDTATHDPIDVAIAKAAQEAELKYGKARRMEFVPFDPLTKRTEALIRKGKHGKKSVQVIKGSPHVISQLVSEHVDLSTDVERLTAAGNRCIAIAARKKDKSFKMVGLLALQDDPRDDASMVIHRLHDLGVRVVMITGDSLETARTIAHQVGIMGPASTMEVIENDINHAAEKFDVFARVYPEDKYKLIEALQSSGHIVGMTGDGVNDAPAIRKADIGVAMHNATDITKAAASLVLTDCGLKGMLAAVEMGRSIFQRISTYTLNKIIKTFHTGLFLSLGLLLTGTLITKPTHLLLIVLANDLVSMSLTTDHVHPSAKPDRWRVTPMIGVGLVMSLGWLAFSFGVYFFGRDSLQLPLEQLYTLTFLMLVCVAQANVYLIREKRPFWRSEPSRWMLLATAVDMGVITLLALGGIMMAPISPALVLALYAVVLGFMLVLDGIKVWAFRRSGLNALNKQGAVL